LRVALKGAHWSAMYCGRVTCDVVSDSSNRCCCLWCRPSPLQAEQALSDSEEVESSSGGGGAGGSFVDGEGEDQPGDDGGGSFTATRRSLEKHRRKGVSSEAFASTADIPALALSSAFFQPSPSPVKSHGGNVAGDDCAVEIAGFSSGGDDPYSAFNTGEGSDFEHPKDEATAKAIKSALSKHFLFKGLVPEVLDGIVRQMFEVTVAPGQRLIQQGATGDNMYVCTEGRLDCHVSNPGVPEPGPKVMEYGPGSSFGELTLMYDCPRPSTVQVGLAHGGVPRGGDALDALFHGTAGHDDLDVRLAGWHLSPR
jgi:hypothetical protein